MTQSPKLVNAARGFKNQRTMGIAVNILIYTILIILSIIWLFPIVWLILNSLRIESLLGV